MTLEKWEDGKDLKDLTEEQNKQAYDLLDPETQKEAIELLDIYAKARRYHTTKKKLYQVLLNNQTYLEYQRYEQELNEALERAKELSKKLLPDGVYTCEGYRFKKSTSNKITRTWDIEKIRAQKWASAVIIEAVDEKVFKALAKTIPDPESYYTETAKSYPTYSLEKEPSDE